MQKKVIALAVAGLVSGAAFAQTNVTVYGLIDQTYLYSKSDDYKFSGIKDGGLNGSRFGFKGEEALGNGLKAIFTMEYGKESDNDSSTANFSNRQAFVGLNGNFGTVTVGRQYNAASMFYSKNTSDDVIGVMPVNSLQGQNGSQIRSGGGTSRQDNVIKYVSPNFSGFTFAANYAFGESNETLAGTSFKKKADITDKDRYSIAGDYTNGPFNVSLSYAGQTSSLGADTEDVSEWFIGGGYDFKVVKLYATYQDLENDNKTAATVTDQSMWSVGAKVPVGAAGVVNFQYAEWEGETGNAAINKDGKSKGWGIGYEHSMSKRTTLYTYLSQIDHDKNVASVGSWQSGAAVAGEKQSNFMAGIRHKF